jgi:hypothetical protein
MRPDLLVHQGLGERRFVALVMPEPPVTEHVNNHRPLERLPVLGRHLGGKYNSFRIVTVHVQDQGLDHLGDIGRIGR